MFSSIARCKDADGRRKLLDENFGTLRKASFSIGQDSDFFSYLPRDCPRLDLSLDDKDAQIPGSPDVYRFSGDEIFNLLSSRNDVQVVVFDGVAEVECATLVELASRKQ